MFGNASIGFSKLPCLAQRKTLRRGFQFTLMVVGEAGLGKSSLINSLFLTDMYPDRTAQAKTTVKIEPTTVEIEEGGVKVKLTIIDTPGFGDSLDDTDSANSIIKYIDEQFEKYYREENSVHRRFLADSRVHACLYFISPFGHGLKPIDVDLLDKIHKRVNLIPIIAKADALTTTELGNLRTNIINFFEEHNIKVYSPDSDPTDYFSEESADESSGDRKGRSGSVQIPFAVSGANTVVSAGGDHKVRGILYPWGFLDVENSKFSDLPILRQFLIQNMQDMLDETHEGFYETYRLAKITEKTYVSEK